MFSGWYPAVHGPRGAGGRHQLLQGRLPQDRHVRVRPGAVGDRDQVPGHRHHHAVQAALRGGGVPPPDPGGDMRPRGTQEGGNLPVANINKIQNRILYNLNQLDNRRPSATFSQIDGVKEYF